MYSRLTPSDIAEELASECCCLAHSGVKEFVGLGWEARAEGEVFKSFQTSPFSIASSIWDTIDDGVKCEKKMNTSIKATNLVYLKMKPIRLTLRTLQKSHLLMVRSTFDR